MPGPTTSGASAFLWQVSQRILRCVATTAQRFEGGFELFGTSVDEILRFVRSTRPAPPVEDVEAHIDWLYREGLVSERDLAVLRTAGYRV